MINPKPHKHSSNHLQEIFDSEFCGCFYCTRIFPTTEIMKWVDEDENGVPQTALCPHCGIDAVIGSASRYEITKEFLLKMNKNWF